MKQRSYALPWNQQFKNAPVNGRSSQKGRFHHFYRFFHQFFCMFLLISKAKGGAFYLDNLTILNRETKMMGFQGVFVQPILVVVFLSAPGFSWKERLRVGYQPLKLWPTLGAQPGVHCFEALKRLWFQDFHHKSCEFNWNRRSLHFKRPRCNPVNYRKYR